MLMEENDNNIKLNRQRDFFYNRLVKNKTHLLKWAKRQHVFCFRLYDRDILEIPLCVDVYYTYNDKEDYSNPIVIVTLYQRPYTKNILEEKQWLSCMSEVIEDIFAISSLQIFIKVRHKKKDTQYYVPEEQKKISFIVKEYQAFFLISIRELLDTGLFLDHRWLRKRIFETAKGKNVLNLFCYTASFSVFAHLGQAQSSTSVDLSQNYLDWAKENFKLNGLSLENARFICSDVYTYLKTLIKANHARTHIHIEKRKYKTFSETYKAIEHEEKYKQKEYSQKLYDIIICDAPTFSNSKKTNTVLNINEDWQCLCLLCLQVLSKDGIFYFSCNSKKIKINKEILEHFKETIYSQLHRTVFIKDMSSISIDPDFKKREPHTLLQFKFI